MKFYPLSKNQFFKKKSDLWILPFETNAYWFKKINWVLQFSIHDLSSNKYLNSPLLIPSSEVFPNKNILCLPFEKEDWFKNVFIQWVRLKKPSLRLFLPTCYNKGDLLSKWPYKKEDEFYEADYLNINDGEF